MRERPLSRWLAVVLVTALLAGLSGCRPFDYYDSSLYGPVPQALEPPRELNMMSLPAYRLAPPDIIQIEVPKLVPLPPYRLETFDLVQISVLGALPEQPINGTYLVDAEGRLDLGPGYGLIRVAGMTVEEAGRAIDAHLRQYLRVPEVSVQLAQPSSIQAVTGQYLIASDGTVNLRRYGSVNLAGRTLAEARQLLEQHLGQFFDAPTVSLDAVAYNSKVFYIITQGAGLGDNVVRVPVTGNETVLDAVSQVQGLSQVSSKRVWIARPAPHGFHCEQTLPVDWDAITQGASVATNYQVMPGDRVYIASDEAVTLTNWVNKIVGPFERAAGFSSLTVSTIRNFKFVGSNNVGGTGY